MLRYPQADRGANRYPVIRNRSSGLRASVTTRARCRLSLVTHNASRPRPRVILMFSNIPSFVNPMLASPQNARPLRHVSASADASRRAVEGVPSPAEAAHAPGLGVSRARLPLASWAERTPMGQPRRRRPGRHCATARDSCQVRESKAEPLMASGVTCGVPDSRRTRPGFEVGRKSSGCPHAGESAQATPRAEPSL